MATDLGAVAQRMARQYERQTPKYTLAPSVLPKPAVVDRPGGGKAVRVNDTGGYRPMVTHNMVCPKCGKWRNVAILGEPMPGIKRLVCEICDWTWLYRASDAPTPLQPGTNGAFRREMLGLHPGQRHVYAERG